MQGESAALVIFSVTPASSGSFGTTQTTLGLCREILVLRLRLLQSSALDRCIPLTHPMGAESSESRTRRVSNMRKIENARLGENL